MIKASGFIILIYLTNQDENIREIYNIAINSNRELWCVDHQSDEMILLGISESELPFKIEDGTIQFVSF